MPYHLAAAIALFFSLLNFYLFVFILLRKDGVGRILLLTFFGTISAYFLMRSLVYAALVLCVVQEHAMQFMLRYLAYLVAIPSVVTLAILRPWDD